MFTEIRKLSEKPLAKIFLLVLALSFIIWGIKMGNDRRNYIATIGDENYIEIEDFKRAKTNFLRSMNQEYNEQVLKDSNLNQIILNNLIQNELLKAEAKSLNLVVSENVALKEIRNMPFFKNKDGKFDKEIFKKALTANRISSSKFINNVKEDIALNILRSNFTNYSPSDNIIKAFYNYKEQTRIVDLITIKPLQEIEVPEIKQEDIKKYYSQHKSKFAVPESKRR